jgi:hypothetical protein
MTSTSANAAIRYPIGRAGLYVRWGIAWKKESSASLRLFVLKNADSSAPIAANVRPVTSRRDVGHSGGRAIEGV